MTTDTKVSDLPAKWRAWAKRIRGITAGSDLAADIMEGAAEDLEAALARQEADKTAASVITLTDAPTAPPAAQADDDWHLRGYAYASKQATTCAGCGEHKHTPLRIDAMGGYVCLTCIDNKLSSLLGEFGYTAAQAVDLSDDFSESKDWRESDYNGRVDWLKAMHVSQRAEIVRLQNDVEILRALIDQQAGKGCA